MEQKSVDALGNGRGSEGEGHQKQTQTALNPKGQTRREVDQTSTSIEYISGHYSIQDEDDDDDDGYRDQSKRYLIDHTFS